MSEKEMNSYRFLSGEEPSDEMLAFIMQEAVDIAMARKRAADMKMRAEVERQRRLLRQRWDARISSNNG